LIDLLVIGANQNINWFTNVLGDSEYFGKNLSCQGNSSKLAKLFADIFDELRMQNKRN